MFSIWGAKKLQNPDDRRQSIRRPSQQSTRNNSIRERIQETPVNSTSNGNDYATHQQAIDPEENLKSSEIPDVQSGDQENEPIDPIDQYGHKSDTHKLIENTKPLRKSPALRKKSQRSNVVRRKVEIDENEHLQSDPIHERVLAVIIHRTDRIKSKIYITHPMVKVHVVNANTGEYARKSHRQRPVAYVNETMPIRSDALDYILPLMTKPSEFRQQDLVAPTWEELLLFNDDFQHFIEASNQIMLMFEVLDFKSMSSVKRDGLLTKDATNSPTDISINDTRTDGWQRIAWAFLKLVSSNGSLNTGNNLRLQLYKAPATTKLRDERQPEVYHWWKYLPRIKYSGTLFVTVKSVDYPRNVPSASRSMYAVQQEVVTGSLTSQHPSTISLQQEEGLAGSQLKEEKENEEPPYAWSRLTGQPCKVPNKLWMTLACGRGGCFRVKFSPNGRFLAGAGAEPQVNKFPIYVYGFPSGKYLGILYGHVQLIYELSWNATDLLLSASADCTVRLWNVHHMRSISTLTHTTFVYCARFHPSDDDLIFTGAFDKCIRIWSLKLDQKKPQIIQEFEPHLNCVNCFCFSADERFLYSGDGGGALRIWASADANKENWMFLKEIKEDRLMGNPINVLEIHPDQKRLFIQSRDGCVRTLELRSLALRAHYRGLNNADTHVRGDLTPCGTLYFAGDGDGKVIVWHVQSVQKFAEYDQLSLAQCPIACVSYHPLDHWVAFAIYGLRQPILIYKHDPSIPELYKEEPQEKKIEPKEGPTFDPDYSLAKLLEEHKLLTKLDLPYGKWSNNTNRNTMPIKSLADFRTGSDTGKTIHQASDSTAASKRVTFGDSVQKSISPSQRRRQELFAHKDMQQSTLMEIPLEDTKNHKISDSSNEATPILEQAPLENALITEMKKTKVISDIQQTTVGGHLKNIASAPAAMIHQASVESTGVSETPIIGQVKAKYNYTAQNDDEISFQKGDIIKVVRKDDVWWVGYVNLELIGYFPPNYVTEIELISQ